MAARKSTHPGRNAAVATGGVELTDADLAQAEELDHAASCMSPRLTTFDSSTVAGELLHVVRCVDCGAVSERVDSGSGSPPRAAAAKKG